MHSTWEVQPGDVLPWLSRRHQTSMRHRVGDVPWILLLDVSEIGLSLGQGEKEALQVIFICNNGNSCYKKNVLHPSGTNEELKFHK